MEKKKNKKGLLILVLLLVAIISGTFAITFSRYYSTITGTGESYIADWAIDIDGVDMTQQATLNLGDCTWENNYTNVAAGVMAPGSTCELEVVVTNNSQVDVDVEATLGDLEIDGNPVTGLGLNVELDQSTVATPLTPTEARSIIFNVSWDVGGDGTTETDTNQTNAGIGAYSDDDLKTMTFDVEFVAKQHVTTGP